MNCAHSAASVVKRILAMLMVLVIGMGLCAAAFAAEEYSEEEPYSDESTEYEDEVEYEDEADYDAEYDEAYVEEEIEDPVVDGAVNRPPVYKGDDGRYYCVDIWRGGDYYGWLQWDGRWYYFDQYDGHQYLGNQWVNGTFHCFDPETGEEQYGWQGGRFFDYDTGNMHTGWLSWDGELYYLNTETGKYLTGWVYLWDDVYGEWGGDWFCFNDDGSAVRGEWKSFAGTRLYFRTDNARPTKGWATIDGNTYYFYQDGSRAVGWAYIDDYYYFDETTGILATGWIKLGGDWYYTNIYGEYVYGWQYIDDNWYYFGGDGKLKTGWTTIGGYDYYFYKENDPYGGVMGTQAVNTWIDGIWIDEYGNAYISYDPYNRMIRNAQEKSSSTEYLIMIDTENCVFGVFQGYKDNWNMIYYWYCAPGAYSTPTVTGEFTIYNKGDYFFSGSAKCLYWCEFYYAGGGYCIHSTLRYADNSPMDSRTGMHLSHGCVRLDIDNAYWVWANCPIGTTVVSY